VVFTVNYSGGDWKNRSTTSPALFNHCVVDTVRYIKEIRAIAEIGRVHLEDLDIGDTGAVGGS
jgi:dynein heavy chain 1